MTKHSLIFGGINSAEYGVWISGDNVFASPSRDVEYVSVPGRNGDLIIDNGKWNNIRLTYPSFIPKGFDSRIDEFRQAISKKKGYHKLEDTYHPEEYRMASFSNGISPKDQSAFNRSGRFDLTFNCKPQRFMKSGDDPITLLPAVTLANTMSSGYFKTGTALDWSIKCPDDVEVTVRIRTYNASGEQRNEYTSSASNGSVGRQTFVLADAYYRFSVEKPTDVSFDDISASVSTRQTINGARVPVEGTLARKFKILNPTGYASKPLIESMSSRLPYMVMTNYIDGEAAEHYAFHVNETPASHFYMDCDLQYVYDDDGNNLTNYLFLTDAHSAAGKGLVFPQLSEDETEIEMYYTSVTLEQGLGEVKIYPRWWKL